MRGRLLLASGDWRVPVVVFGLMTVAPWLIVWGIPMLVAALRRRLT